VRPSLPAEITKQSLYEKFYRWIQDESPDWISNRVDESIFRPICWIKGHLVLDDSCRMPAHRYCLRCGKGTPDKEVVERYLFKNHWRKYRVW
jgi:hypothetical protein